jgi:hypothetical protein
MSALSSLENLPVDFPSGWRAMFLIRKLCLGCGGSVRLLP